MHIVIVTPEVSKTDGQGSINYYAAERALAQGHRVTLLARVVDVALLRSDGVAWVPIRVKLPTDLLSNLAFGFAAARWIRRHCGDIDVLHTNGACTLAAADINSCHFLYAAWLRSADMRRIKLRPRELYHRLFAVINAALERYAFRRAGIVVAYDVRMGAELTRIGVSPERIVVIQSGIDLERFRARPTQRERFGLPTGVPMISFAGDIASARKNVDALLDLIVDVPELHLAVAGKLDQSPYPEMARERGIAERVHFVGFRADVSELFASTDLFVFLSHYEPFGLVVPQAMASGIPVITTQNVGSSTLVPPDAGIVLPARPARQLVRDTVVGLLSDDAQRRAMGERAAQVAADYGFERMGDCYVDVYERSLHAQRRSRAMPRADEVTS